jgi:putative intracellular protease/amidase
MGDAYFNADAKKFMHDAAAVAKLGHSLKLDACAHADYQCLYVAGGHGCCVDGEAMKGAVESFHRAGKLVAADCHGPYVLMFCEKPDGSPLVQGLEVTAFTDLEEEQAGATAWVAANAKFMEAEFVKQGAKFQKADPWHPKVCVAGTLVTAQNPQSAEACANKCIELMSA